MSSNTEEISVPLVPETELRAVPQIRITSHGKIRTWVEYSLNLLENTADAAVTFHTLPPPKSSSRTENSSVESRTLDDTGTSIEGHVPAESKSSKKLASSAACIPRLVSVVEIIKREFLKKAPATAGQVGGLHQYNEIGYVEENGSAADLHIVLQLNGSKFLKQQRTPFIKVTLSRQRLPETVLDKVTYQTPITKTLSRSARARAKKRSKKDGEKFAATEEMIEE
ncbi:hypothetical protein JAAARDRAFT_33946 [Jaapia argillacea MUCL 33604]|uniref:Uncharacterized protein n=1 Tax=Jaapia argillacea MUCL 33604 TaxID=933084 RepID=A0A067PZ92_9AGAM|nr:hypothetical protein JAAARDRAFT_33946 [Jaapia argillacea MUCL 33604]